MEPWKFILATVVAGTCLAGEPVITCEPFMVNLHGEPRELRGVPGEPLQLEVTVETDRATHIQLRIPAIKNLFLRTVEKIPIQRTEEGRYIQKRIIIWQGLESGTTTLTNLVVRFQGSENSTQKVPSIGIIIDAVEPAKPPKNPPRPAATPPTEGNQSSSLHNPLLRRGAGTAGWVSHIPEPVI